MAYNPGFSWGRIKDDVVNRNFDAVERQFKQVAQAIQNPLLTLPIYADNAAAIAGGLLVGQLYRTNSDPDTVCIVH